MTRAQLNLLIGHQVVVKGRYNFTMVCTMNDEGVIMIQSVDPDDIYTKEIHYSEVQFQVRLLSNITSEELQRLLDLTGGNKRKVVSVDGFGGFKEIPVLHYTYRQPDESFSLLKGNTQFQYMSLDQYLYLFERRLDVLGLIEKGYGILPDKS